VRGAARPDRLVTALVSVLVVWGSDYGAPRHSETSID